MKSLAILYVLADVAFILLSMYVYRDDAQHWADYLLFYTAGGLMVSTFRLLKSLKAKQEEAAVNPN